MATVCTTVVDCTKKQGQRVEWDLYCGRGRCPCGLRQCTHLGGFGNPFPNDVDPLGRFFTYCVDRWRTQLGYRAALLNHKGQRFACWCADKTPGPGVPIQCHAEIMARLVDGEAPDSIARDLPQGLPEE